MGKKLWTSFITDGKKATDILNHRWVKSYRHPLSPMGEKLQTSFITDGKNAIDILYRRWEKNYRHPLSPMGKKAINILYHQY
jgi:hypothetical protein